MLSTPVQAAADWVAQLTGARRALLAVFAGAISVLAFAPVHAWPVLFVSFGLLVWLLDGCHASHAELGGRLTCAAFTGFWFGFGYFLTGLYWIAEAFLVEPWRHGWLIPFVMTALPGGMALFYAAAAALAACLWRPGPARVFALAIAFALAEFARGHILTGLPWNLLGYGLAATLPMMQLAAIFGVYALSLLAVLLFASPFAIWAPQGSGLARPKGTALLTLAFCIALALGAAWGQARLATAMQARPACGFASCRPMSIRPINGARRTAPRSSTPISISPNLAAATAVSTASRSWSGRRRRCPSCSPSSSQALTAIGDVLPDGTSLLVGSGRIVEERDAQDRLVATRVYNSLLAISDKGEVLDGYDKIHLVPFGEYLPFQDLMESLGIFQLTGVRGGFSAGTGSRLLSVPGAPQARPLICYEIIFPDEISNDGPRPGWLLNVTNDAWFGGSAGPYQHFHQAQLRAVEQGLPVVRAANTGISAIIDPYGRVLARARSEEGRSRRRAFARGFADYEIRNVGTLDRDRGSRHCASLLALFRPLECESKAGPRVMNGFVTFANASHREQGR